MKNSLIRKSGHIFSAKHDKPIAYDFSYSTTFQEHTPVVFVHGFKGFKDWGPFNVISEQFAAQGCCFIKLNLSHNGTTLDAPTDFSDLDAFSKNNFSIELDDIGVLIDFLLRDDFPIRLAKDKLSIIGHSRGGGLAILKTKEDQRIRKLTTWAALTDIRATWRAADLEDWKKTQTIYIDNSRTQQKMPMHYQIVEDFLRNEARLDIPQAIGHIAIPFLAFHGDSDATLPIQMAQLIPNRNKNAQLIVVSNSNHTFEATHPFEGPLPANLKKVVHSTLDFILQK